jgi:hypothetical protein
VTAAPYANNSEPAPATNAASQRTYQENVQKPAPEPNLKPIPRLNSMSAPLLPDPQDRTAIRASYTTARVDLVASSANQTSSVQFAAPAAANTDGWSPAKD